MAFVYGAIMLIGLIGMIACSKKQRTNPSMQTFAVIIFVFVVIAGILLMRDLGVFGVNNAKRFETERTFYASRGYVAGDYLKTLKPNGKLVLLAEADYATNETVKRLVEAIKDGYGSNVVVASLDLPAGNNEMDMPMSMRMRAKDFDKFFKDNEDAGIIISAVGLPEDAPRMKYWKNKKDRPVFFMLYDNGMVSGISGLIYKGDISGIVISSPDANYEIDAPRDPSEAFKIRYVLVTKENVQQYRDRIR